MPITQLARPTRRRAVAVLGGDVDLDRQARPGLDDLARREARVVGGAAGDDAHGAQRGQLLVREAELRAVAVGEVLEHRRGDGGRLLGDLLAHERVEAALVRRARARRWRARVARRRPAAPATSTPSGGDDDELAVGDLEHAARLVTRTRHRGGDEVLAVAEADDQRALPCARRRSCRAGRPRRPRPRSGRAACARARSTAVRQVAVVRSEPIRCATTSASVSREARALGLELASRRLGQFSTMPLSTICTRRSACRCAGARWPRSPRRAWPSGCGRCRPSASAVGGDGAGRDALGDALARSAARLPTERDPSRRRRRRGRAAMPAES